jgi:four helix bundle protein
MREPMSSGNYLPEGSLTELETQILIAKRLGYFDEERVASLLDISAEVGRLVNGIIRSKGE